MAIGRVPGATGIQPSIVDAKGDLIVATAADSVARLAVGTNGYTLVADSSVSPTGLKWSSANDRYPWSSYTVTTTGVTLGNGTVVGKYQEIGKLVNVKITFTFGSTSSFSLPRFSIPVTAVANSTAQIGFATYVDTGTELYWGICAFENTTTVQAFSTNDTGGNPYRRYIDNTIPFTWASGDLMLLNFSYEAA